MISLTTKRIIADKNVKITVNELSLTVNNLINKTIYVQTLKADTYKTLTRDNVETNQNLLIINIIQ